MTRPTLWIRNAREVVVVDDPFTVIERGAVVCAGDRIVWVGVDGAWPDELAPGAGARVLDAAGGVVTPGLIDCHTHLVFGGSRASEFARRLAGVSYAEILAGGGGILSTVRATRAAPEAELAAAGRARLAQLQRHGVTTVEAKSGYGLDVDTELKILRVVAELGVAPGADVLPTFLGAHAIPAEHREHRDVYLELVVGEMLPRVAEHGLARYCDVFCEPGLAFDVEESRRVLTSARALGMQLKVHADQLSAGGGARLAGDLGALSADHLEFVDEDGIEAMARGNTVAVLLPGAAYFLDAPSPPVAALRAAGVPMAVSTDLNPGSSPTTNLLLMASMACVRWRLTVEEAFAAVTCHAASALGLQRDRGRLLPGMRADLALFDVPDHRELVYWFGHDPCTAVVKDGAPVAVR